MCTQRQAVQQLRERFPQFRKFAGKDDRMSFDTDDPYLVFGDFGIQLKRTLSADTQPEGNNRPLDVVLAFEFIGDLLRSSRPDIINLVEVGVLESLTACPRAVEIARTSLDDETFNKFLELFNRAAKGR